MQIVILESNSKTLLDFFWQTVQNHIWGQCSVMIHRIQMYLPILRLIVSKLHDGGVVMLLIQESMFCVWQGFLLDRECIQWTKIWENMCSRSITMGKYIYQNIFTIHFLNVHTFPNFSSLYYFFFFFLNCFFWHKYDWSVWPLLCTVRFFALYDSMASRKMEKLLQVLCWNSKEIRITFFVSS